MDVKQEARKSLGGGVSENGAFLGSSCLRVAYINKLAKLFGKSFNGHQNGSMTNPKGCCYLCNCRK